MTREEKVQFLAKNISEFEEVENTKTLQDECRKLSDEELDSKIDFVYYLWEK